MSDTSTTGGGSPSGSGADPTDQPVHPSAPDYVMAKVQLLLSQETAPETNVTFGDTQQQSPGGSQ